MPTTPDFSEFLQRIPVKQRTGPVFRPIGKNGLRLRRRDTVSKYMVRIEKSAGVKVITDSKTGRVKFASSHDLRRSFGNRWAMRVTPVVLQQLMRHETIDTTMKFYTDQDAETRADASWAASVGVGTFVGTSQNSSIDSATEKPQTLLDKQLK